LPEVNGEFVWRMEEVLNLYAQPLDKQRPVVCFDEASKELRADVRAELPVEPGQPVRQDCGYERRGTANMFMLLCPLLGWRQILVTQRRRYGDFAHMMKTLVDVYFPKARQIRVVLDNLNTHTKGALYEAFAPDEAKRIADRLEFIFTPKHASWLNMAELEWSVLTRQCLDRRVPDIETLAREVEAWQEPRNKQRTRIRWCFRVADARVKLGHLYPAQIS
jgi:transposase